MKQILPQVANNSEIHNEENGSKPARIPNRTSRVVRDKYWAAVGRLVMMRAASYYHRLDLSMQEYEFITDAWTEALRNVVSSDQLRNAYRLAVRDHAGQSTVSVSEVIQAYGKFMASTPEITNLTAADILKRDKC